jgi:alpha-ketoglutaric semialdehyde dehydrogenase
VLEHEGRLTEREHFGPLATLVSTRSVDDHRRLAKASGLALSSAIYGRDSDAIRRMINVAGTGVVAVNRPSTGLEPNVPFGGWGRSGSQFSEQGTEGLRFYMKWQTVYWRADPAGAEFP